MIAEKDAVIAELTATVKAQAAQIADFKAKLATANKDSSKFLQAAAVAKAWQILYPK